MTTYPSEFMRGINQENFFFPDGLPSELLFKDFSSSNHKIGYDEISITWCDNDEAIRTILSQKKLNDKDGLQFKFGIGIVKRSFLDILKRNPQFSGILDYERYPTANNKYHGNILLAQNKNKSKRNMLASALALQTQTIFWNKVINEEMRKNNAKCIEDYFSIDIFDKQSPKNIRFINSL